MRRGLFLLSFLVAVGFWPGALEAAYSARWALMAAGCPVLLLLSERPVASFGGAGLICLIAMGSTLAWTSDLPGGIGDFATLAVFGMVICLGSSVKDLRPAWEGLSAGIAISAAVAIGQLFFDWTPVAQVVPPGGLFMNKNILAEAALVALVPALFYRSWPMAVGPAIALLLGGSRAAFGGLALVAMVWLWNRGNRALALGLGLAILALVMSFFLRGDYSAGQRLDMWTATIEGLRPFGHGLGSYPADWPIWQHPHNEPLEMAYELGIFAIFPIALVGHLLRESSYGPEFLVAVAVIGIGLFGFPLHMPVTSFAAALALGGLARARHDLGADELQLGIFDGEGRIGAALRPRADRTAGPGAGFQPNMSAAAGYGSCPSPAFQDSGIDRMREQMRAIRAYFEQTHQIRSAP